MIYLWFVTGCILAFASGNALAHENYAAMFGWAMIALNLMMITPSGRRT